MTQISEYREKWKEKIFLGVLTADPPHLVKKEHKQSIITNFYLYPFYHIKIDNFFLDFCLGCVYIGVDRKGWSKENQALLSL